VPGKRGKSNNHGVTGELLGKFLRPATGRNSGASVKEAIVRQICLKGPFKSKLNFSYAMNFPFFLILKNK
jgi:hypothetical protein